MLAPEATELLLGTRSRLVLSLTLHLRRNRAAAGGGCKDAVPGPVGSRCAADIRRDGTVSD